MGTQTPIFILFIAFVGIGLFARNFNTRVCLLILLVAAGMVAYGTLR